MVEVAPEGAANAQPPVYLALTKRIRAALPGEINSRAYRAFAFKSLAVSLGFMALAVLLGMLGDYALAQQPAQPAPAPAAQQAPAAQPAPATPGPPARPAAPATQPQARSTGALPPPAAGGQPGALDRALGAVAGDGRPLSLSLQILILMSLLTVLPSIILMMTSFTRIIIVLSILRQAIGLNQTPPNQVLIGLSLFLSIFVMRPVLNEIGATAYTPYGAGQISIEEAVSRSGRALHGFMMNQTREADLRLFSDLANTPSFASPDQVPFSILLPAFVTSELKTAFQIGFLIFLPFLIIDIVVSSTLMALGMMMLSPPIVSMPFKLLLFVLVDGWTLTMGSLAQSFASG